MKSAYLYALAVLVAAVYVTVRLAEIGAPASALFAWSIGASACLVPLFAQKGQ